MKALKANDVAARLNCSVRYARELMKQKDFPSFIINKSPKQVHRRVYEDDFAKWLENRKESGIVI